MDVRIVTLAEQPDAMAPWGEAAWRVWPAFMLHGTVANTHWRGLAAHFPGCQFAVFEKGSDTFVGVGNTVPVAWDGTASGLPGGVDDVLETAIGKRESQPPATALCALQAAILPEFRGRGLSTAYIGAMREIAVGLGLPDLIAPVRPNEKSRYPLTPMERYIAWQRPDGLPFDAWLRVHARLGAEILTVAERSMEVTGSVAEWESWTGMAFPDSGPYIVPGALIPIGIDRAGDLGTYVEPNVWMRHRLASG